MSVSRIDNYQRQLRILDDWHLQSIAVRGRFEAGRERYQQQIRQAHQLGYMGDYVDQLEQRFREFSSQMEQVLDILRRGEQRINEQTTRIHSNIASAQQQS